MNPHDSRTLTVKSLKSMDSFNMIDSTNTVGEHRTETRSNAPGYNRVFSILKSSSFAKIKISLMNPHDSRTLTVKSSKSMDLFNMRDSTNTVGEHPTETRSNAPGYDGVFFILKSSNVAKNKTSPDEPP